MKGEYQSIKAWLSYRKQSDILSKQNDISTKRSGICKFEL